jgi:hypothetical protein
MEPDVFDMAAEEMAMREEDALRNESDALDNEMEHEREMDDHDAEPREDQFRDAVDADADALANIYGPEDDYYDATGEF